MSAGNSPDKPGASAPARKQKQSVWRMMLFTGSFYLDIIHYIIVVYELYVIFVSSRYTAKQARDYCLSEPECIKYLRYSCGGDQPDGT